MISSHFDNGNDQKTLNVTKQITKLILSILGDKIMVSVNFKNSANKSAAEIAATTKPSVTIDIMSSPYQVIEASPEPIVDVYRLVFMNSNKGSRGVINGKTGKHLP